MNNLVRDWFRATERCNISQLNRFKDQVNIEATTTWNMNNEEHRNVTALTLSAYIGRKEVVKWFIDLGCRVNVATHLGWTPLHFAASQGFVSTVDMLCQAGAKIDVKTNRNETAIQLALKGNMRDTVRKLLNRGASIENLDHSKVGRGARGIISASGRDVHGGSRGRGGGQHGGHSRSGGGIANGQGRSGGHHGHSGHAHGGGHHHGGAHHHGHYGGREGSIRDGGGGSDRASSAGGGGGGSSGGGGGGSGSGESAEVARKRRELFRQMGDESRLGKAIRQLMRDPCVRQNVASVRQALVDHFSDPQPQARQWKRQSEILVDNLEMLLCEQQTPEGRSNRRLLSDCIFLIVDHWSDSMYGDYLMHLVDAASRDRAAITRCAMLDLVRQFLARESKRRKRVAAAAARAAEDASGAATATEAAAEAKNEAGLLKSPDRGDALSIISFELLEQVLRLLDTDDCASVIAACCRALLAYSRIFRASFLEEEHFFTLVDHVVGWCVDPKTPDADADMLCQCVAQCRPLWRARPQFAKEMTTNLLEDVESNVPAIPPVAEGGSGQSSKVRAAMEKERAALEDSWIRISRYLRVACAIFCSLGLQATDCPASVRRLFDHEALMKVASQIVKLVTPILRHLALFLQGSSGSSASSQAALTVVMLSNSPALFASANWLLTDLIYCLFNGNNNTAPSNVEAAKILFRDTVVFLVNQMILASQANSSANYALHNTASAIQHQIDYQLSVISLMEVLVDRCGSGGSFEWVILYRLLGPLSPIHNYKLTANSRVQRRLLSAFIRFAHLDSLPLVDVFYQILLSDLEVCLQTVIRACDSCSKVALVRENGFQERHYSPDEALSLAIFNLCVISELGVSSLPGLWSLTPTLFDLFVKYAPLRDLELMQAYPELHVAMFSALFAHCRAQKWLVDCSGLIGSASSCEVETFPRKDGYLEELLILVADVLDKPGLSLPLCDLLLDCVSGVVSEALEHKHLVVLVSEPMDRVISSLLTFVANRLRSAVGSNGWKLGATAVKHIQRACSLLESFLQHRSPGPISREHLLGFTDFLHGLAPVGGPAVTVALLAVLARLPPDAFLQLARECQRAKGAGEEKSLLNRQWRVGRHSTSGALALRMPLWTGDRFRLEHCQLLLAAVLWQSTPPNAAPEWLTRLYSAICLSEGGVATGEGQERLLVPRSLQWSALLWDTVRHFLELKLKVPPWSKPTDAFLEIEQVLQRVSESIRPSRRHSKTKEKPSAWFVSLLLLFMEWLERALYHAYEGAATIVIQPPLAPAIRNFFRTNRKTCLTWLNRNRLTLMRIGQALGLHPFTLRHGLFLLQDASPEASEREEVLRVVCKSLRALGQSEMLKGTSVWFANGGVGASGSSGSGASGSTGGSSSGGGNGASPSMLPLLEGMAELAAGRVERAQVLLDAQLERCANPGTTQNGLTTDASGATTTVAAGSQGQNGSGNNGDGTVRRGAGDVVLLLNKQTVAQQQQTSQAVNARAVEAMMRGTVDELVQCYSQLQDFQGLRTLRERLSKWTVSSQGAVSSAAASILHQHPENWKYWQCASKLMTWDEDKWRHVGGGSDAGEFSPWDVGELLISQERAVYSALSCGGGKGSGGRLTRMAEAAAENVHGCAAMVCAYALHWPGTMPPALYASIQEAQLVQRAVAAEPQEGRHLASVLLRDSAATGQLSMRHIQLQRLLTHFMPDQEEVCEADDLGVVLPLVRWCRRFDNVQSATRLLLDGWRHFGATSAGTPPPDLAAVLPAIQCLPRSDLTPRLEREVAKVLRQAGQSRDAWFGLCDSVVQSLAAAAADGSSLGGAARALHAQSALILVKWLRADGPDAEGQSRTLAQPLLSASQRRALNYLSGLSQEKWPDGVVPLSFPEAAAVEEPVDLCLENVVGRLSVLASKLSPMMAKAWYAVGAWSFERSRDDLRALASKEFRVGLTAPERAALEALLPAGYTEEEAKQTAAVLTALPITGSRESGRETIDCSVNEEDVRRRLGEVFCLQIAGPETIDALVAIWRGVLDRVYGLSVSAANGFFTFLRLSGAALAGEEEEEQRLTATLRLLKLLANHIHELGHLLAEGFASSPTEPWLHIIPQVFARLNHPSPGVRDCLTRLVCRLAKDAPHRIVYPAVVGAACASSKAHPGDAAAPSDPGVAPEAGVGGASASGPPRFFSAREEAEATVEEEEDVGQGLASDMDEVVGEDTELENSKSDNTEDPVLVNTFTSLMEAMRRDNPMLVDEVATFVEEMRRITVLWDELWLGTLSQHVEELQKKAGQLQAETRRVQDHEHLSSETKERLVQVIHDTYLKPVVHSLEKIRFITSAPAETPHEEWFQEQFEETIDDVIGRLKATEEPTRPEAASQALKALHQAMQQKSQARRRLIGQGQLDLAQISPRLAAIDASLIPMPGEDRGGVCIREIQNAFFILPTKTKPKKLIFVGDNGQRYPYLFKGLEDLHLDERIMQLLGTVNAMFTRLCRPPHNETPRYFARHYAVTPLGPRSGLIQMVQGATPLFALYKKWQQREAYAAAQRQQRPGSQAGGPVTAPSVLAPSELFLSKLRPALEAKGIHAGPDDAKILEGRKDWPIGVLRSVLVELMRETPSDLLTRELWMSSISSVDWWQSSLNYARSVAVMSVIGYIIGLGDRHLDNVMVDLSNGEIVHIDYNVCFEKGKNLKVPETVPFRLTAVLRHALGPTGVEGMFRLSSERVLRTLREHQDVLLTLLDAFVYDPLIDWTPGSESGYAGAHYGGHSEAAREKFPTRRQLERDMTLQFLGIRIAEMDHAWRLWQADFETVLEHLREPIEHLAQLAASIGAESRRLQLYQEMADYLKRPGDSSEPAPYKSLPARYTHYSQRETSRRRVQQVLSQKFAEVGKWCERHEEAFLQIRSEFVPSSTAKLRRKLPALSNFHEAAASFLENAGQAPLIDQAAATVARLAELSESRSASLGNCLSVLTLYRSHAELHCEEHALADRYRLLRRLLDPAVKQPSPADIRAALENYQRHFPREAAPPRLEVTEAGECLRSRVSELSRRLAATLAERRQVPTNSGGAEDSMDLLCNSLFHTISIDGGSALKLAIAEALHALCRDWSNLDERLMKASAPGGLESDVILQSSLNLDNDESASWFLYEGSRFAWFLNEIAVFIGSVRVDVITPIVNETNQVSEAFKLVRLLDELSTKLRQLHTNFCNILLPEAIRILTGASDAGRQDPMESVFRLAEAGEPLLAALEARMRTAAEAGAEDELSGGGAAASGPELLALQLQVRRLRKEWYELLERMEKEKASRGSLPHSQLLILGFYNEFNQLEQAFVPLVQAFRVLFMPSDWYFVDSLTTAYNCLQPAWYTEHSDKLFTDLLFLRGLRVMSDVFRTCRRFSHAFHNPQEAAQGSLEAASPDMVRALVTQHLTFVWGGVLCGVGPSLAAFLMCALLEDARLSLAHVAAEQTRCFNGMTAPAQGLIQMALDCRAQDHTTMAVTQSIPPPWHDFSYLHSHVTHLVTAMNSLTHRQHTQVVMESCVKMVEGRLQRAQRVLASYQWLHTDRIDQNDELATPNRASILDKLELSAEALTDLNKEVAAAAAEMERHHDSIEHRLNWSKGVNPGVASVLDSVEEAYQKNLELMREEKELAQGVLTTVEAILHLESFRTRSPQAVKSDAEIAQFLTDCSEELAAADSGSGSPCEVTDLEKELMEALQELVPSAKPNDDDAWAEAMARELSATSAEVRGAVKDGQKRLRDQLAALARVDAELRASVTRHGRLLTTHDIRTVLKALGRFDDPRVKAYAIEYRRFSGEFSALLRLLSDVAKESSEGAIVTAAGQMAALRERLVSTVGPLHAHLCRLAPCVLLPPKRSAEEGVEGEDGTEGEASGAAASAASSSKTRLLSSSAPSLGQARNPFAMAVWRRVQAKLTGKDGPAARGREPLGVEEQVEWIIKEATNLDNLALMYEGWTAWL